MTAGSRGRPVFLSLTCTTWRRSKGRFKTLALEQNPLHQGSDRERLSGHFHIDSVHQGDEGGRKGLYTGTAGKNGPPPKHDNEAAE